MRRAPPGLDALLAEATRLASGAAARVLADPRGQEALARAVGLAQRSLRGIEALQADLMKAAGVPGRQDYQALARQLARVKRKARELNEKLAARQAAARPADPAGGVEPPPDEGSGGAR